MKDIQPPIIVCNEEHRFITAEQIRKINIKPSSILLEPFGKNTAPAITCAALQSLSYGEDPILLILPSDHKIKNIEVFLESIIKAQLSAQEGNIVTFGIKPNKPATGYGYIKADKDFRRYLNPFKIKKFMKSQIASWQKLVKDKVDWNSEFYCKSERFNWRDGKISPEIITFASKL